MLKADGCLCQECGKNYREDVSLPDDLWNAIRPKGKQEGAGLLCGGCIGKKITEQIAALEAAVKEKSDRIYGYEQYFRGEDNTLINEMNEQITELKKMISGFDAAWWEALHKRIATLKADLSKSPTERTYCAGCSLPSDNQRQAEEIATLKARLRRHGDIETDTEEAALKTKTEGLVPLGDEFQKILNTVPYEEAAQDAEIDYPSDHEAVMFLKTSTSIK